jgi:hypothetical protein
MAGNDASGTVHSATDGGVAGSHPTVADAGVLVGPSTASEQNLVTAGLIPVACWRVDDVRFDFDSSFVLPAVAEEIVALAKLREAHKKPVVPRTDPKLPQFIFPPLSIFGHADPVGQDDYNKLLSGRRAAAIYGMLTRRDEVWEDLYSNQGVFTGPAAGDKWGTRAIQTMLTELGFPPGNGDDQSGSDTTSAVCSFQSSQGLSPDGKPGQQTRKKLFLAYMDKLCGADFKLDKEDDFLARGKDSAGKGDYQGCGEFNPILIFSEQQNKDFEQDQDKTGRNASNAPNRRVMVLLFRPGSKVLASKWPCPKAKEGVAGCKKRFWSDGQRRRTDRLPEEERKFEKTHDTFGCRFYQRLSSNSPCDRTLSSIRIRLYDLEGKFVARAPFQFTVGSAKPVLGTASNEGEFVLRDVELPNRLVINWGFEPAKGKGPDLVFASDMFVTISDVSTEQTGADGSFPEEFKQKLHNLGYPRENPGTANVKAFQQDFGHLAEPGVQPNGELDDATAKLIRDVFRTCADDLRNMAPKA